MSFPAPAMLAQTARTAPLDSVHRLGEAIEDLRRRCDAQARDPATVDVTFTNLGGGDPGSDDFDADRYLEGVAALERLGVTWIQVTIPGDTLAHARETIERFGTLVAKNC